MQRTESLWANWFSCWWYRRKENSLRWRRKQKKDRDPENSCSQTNLWHEQLAEHSLNKADKGWEQALSRFPIVQTLRFFGMIKVYLMSEQPVPKARKIILPFAVCFLPILETAKVGRNMIGGQIGQGLRESTRTRVKHISTVARHMCWRPGLKIKMKWPGLYTSSKDEHES